MFSFTGFSLLPFGPVVCRFVVEAVHSGTARGKAVLLTAARKRRVRNKMDRSPLYNMPFQDVLSETYFYLKFLQLPPKHPSQVLSFQQ